MVGMAPELLATNVTAAAVAIAQGKSAEDIGLLSAVFVQLGDVLATIASAREKEEACREG